MRDLTTWKIGGPAEYVYWPTNCQNLVEAVKTVKAAGIPLWIIGRGSNLLIADKGLPGLTIVCTDLNKITWGDYKVSLEAGYSLARLAQEAGQRGWSGLEFARGIPGTIGGALIMNAGAYGDEIAQKILEVRVLVDGQLKKLKSSDLKFAYRESSLRGKALVLEAEFYFEPGDRDQILTTMKNNLAKRIATQPLELPNAGSIFRNPPGDSAGRLIEVAGWKGKSRGGAFVSVKHANFIVNAGGATASDVLSLMDAIREDILGKFGIELHPEVEYLTLRG